MDIPQKRILVWDVPTRIFHWSLVALFGAMWWTGEERMLDWHRLSGYTLIALLLFRIIWGFVGSSTVRFAEFVRGPRTVAHYVRHEMFARQGRAHVGHNPVGGWSVIAIVSLLLVQCVLGLFAVDVDGLESGPFSYLVEFESGRVAAEWHELLFNLMLAVVALHVAAVLFYKIWRGQNLVGPMISGHRLWDAEPPHTVRASLMRGVVIMVLCGALVWAAVSTFGQA